MQKPNLLKFELASECNKSISFHQDMVDPHVFVCVTECGVCVLVKEHTLHTWSNPMSIQPGHVMYQSILRFIPWPRHPPHPPTTGVVANSYWPNASGGIKLAISSDIVYYKCIKDWNQFGSHSPFKYWLSIRQWLNAALKSLCAALCLCNDFLYLTTFYDFNA